MAGKRSCRIRYPGEAGGRFYGKTLRPSKRRSNGVIRFWDNVRGYGFVAVEGYKDIFMPASSLPSLRKAPVCGQRVHFNVGVGRDGKPQAENVVVKAAKVTFKVQKGKRGIK